MWTWTFWKQALERALKTAAQVAAAYLAATAADVFTLDWRGLGSLVAFSVVGSLLMSVGSSEVGSAKGSPSAVATTSKP